MSHFFVTLQRLNLWYNAFTLTYFVKKFFILLLLPLILLASGCSQKTPQESQKPFAKRGKILEDRNQNPQGETGGSNDEAVNDSNDAAAAIEDINALTNELNNFFTSANALDENTEL